MVVSVRQRVIQIGIVLGVVGRVMPPEKRSWGLGLVTAAGGVGQFTVVPLGQVLLGEYGWSLAFMYLSAFGLIIVCCGLAIGQAAKNTPAKTSADESAVSLKEAIKEAALAATANRALHI